jgi:hypothetical protein
VGNPSTFSEDISAAYSAFAVSPWTHFLGGLVHRFPALWLRLGRLETRSLEKELRAVALRMPIYVCGLARSGSTLLHEVICTSASVATHRVKDYPLVFAPFWWRRAAAQLPPTPPRPRAHGDGMSISLDSPDALEEMLWMAFFPACHDPRVCQVMGAKESHPDFESFHRDHLRKLTLAEGKSRYAAKANYHVARLSYLARMYPDVRFVLPVRSPESHIASLMRQQQRFARGQRKHRRSLEYMRSSGHFEFGLDRRPMNLGDRPRVAEVRRAWAKGEEARGLAICWDMVYGHMARVLEDDERVRKAALVVRFETLCAEPAATLGAVLDHCRLEDRDAILQQYTQKIRSPDYYKIEFTAADRAAIRAETAATARRFGY